MLKGKFTQITKKKIKREGNSPNKKTVKLTLKSIHALEKDVDVN